MAVRLWPLGDEPVPVRRSAIHGPAVESGLSRTRSWSPGRVSVSGDSGRRPAAERRRDRRGGGQRGKQCARRRDISRQPSPTVTPTPLERPEHGPCKRCGLPTKRPPNHHAQEQDHAQLQPRRRDHKERLAAGAVNARSTAATTSTDVAAAITDRTKRVSPSDRNSPLSTSSRNTVVLDVVR